MEVAQKRCQKLNTSSYSCQKIGFYLFFSQCRHTPDIIWLLWRAQQLPLRDMRRSPSCRCRVQERQAGKTALRVPFSWFRSFRSKGTVSFLFFLMEPVYNIRNKISVKKKLNFYFISLWYNTHGHIRGLAAYSVYLLFSQQILRFAGIACSYHALWKKISASQLLSSPANMV